MTTLEYQLCTGRDHSASVHVELYKRVKERNNDRDLHLSDHTHNAGYQFTTTQAYSRMMNIYESFSNTEPKPFRWARVKCV